MSKYDYTDILCSRAWYCDDCETWHKEDLWVHGDGTYTTADDCGDHEPLDEEDNVEAYIKDADASWLEYAQWVAEHGKDPCGNYIVDYTETVKEDWEVKITDWIGREKHGYAVYEARHGDKIYTNFADHLTSYLCLKKIGDRYCMEDITMEDIRNEATVEGNGPTYTVKLTIEYAKPRNEIDIAAELRALAQKHLAKK